MVVSGERDRTNVARLGLRGRARPYAEPRESSLETKGNCAIDGLHLAPPERQSLSGGHYASDQIINDLPRPRGRARRHERLTAERATRAVTTTALTSSGDEGLTLRRDQSSQDQNQTSNKWLALSGEPFRSTSVLS